MANQSCSGSTIIANRHYKNNAFVMTQNARCILTMENIAYYEFTKMMKNKNVLRMLTRDTIMHTQMAPDPHVILWWACRAGFWTICLRAPPDNEFKTLPCLAHAKISFWFMTCTYVWFWCFFLQIRQLRKRPWNQHQNNISTLHTRWRPPKCCCGSWLFVKLLLPR